MTVGLDRSVVDEILQRHLGPGRSCRSLERATFGNSQETYLLDVAGPNGESVDQLVIRRTAAGGTLEWSDRAREVAALGAAAAAGLPVPRVRWWEPDGGTLGRAYVVMDRAPGGPPDLRNAAVTERLADDIGRRLAQLHAASIPPAFGGAAPAAPASVAEVTRWTERARATGLAPELALALCGWLARTAPDDALAGVLLWGDPGPHNVLTDAAGTVTAVLDWELAAVGHRAQDVGAARWACLGGLDRERLTTTYERAAGVRLDRHILAWFEVLACVSRSVMLLDGVRAALDGRADDPNVLALGHVLLATNLVRAGRLAWRRDVADAAAVETPAALLHPTAAERDAVLARFLATTLAPAVTGARERRQTRIAAALLAPGPEPVSREPGDPDAAGSSYDAELAGGLPVERRRSLVAGMLAARRADPALLELYGAAVALG